MLIKDCYFAFSNDPDEGACVTITQRELWDAEKCYDDSHDLDEEAEALGFTCLMESVFEYDSFDFGLEEAKDVLLKAGAIQNNELLTHYGLTPEED